MLAAWKAAGADGVMLNCPDLAAARENLRKSEGYSQRFLGGPGLRNVFEWKKLLADSSVAAGFQGLYLDDGWFAWAYDGGAAPPWTPFDPAGCWNGFDSVLSIAEEHDMDVGVNVYELEGIRLVTDAARRFDERHRDAVTRELTTSRLKRLLIFTGARYFDNGPRYLDYSDKVVSWAGANGIPLERFQPWIAPSCSTPHGASIFTQPDCAPDWTLTQVLRLAELGYGGLYVYLANGFDAEHRDKLLTALWAAGNLKLPARPRPADYGGLRALLSDSAAFAPVLEALRAIGIPTHRPGWEWE